MTTNSWVEQWLNTKYGVESESYQELARLLHLGAQNGSAAYAEVADPRYCRSRIGAPSEETYCS
jgi:hypothetical protein